MVPTKNQEPGCLSLPPLTSVFRLLPETFIGTQRHRHSCCSSCPPWCVWHMVQTARQDSCPILHLSQDATSGVHGAAAIVFTGTLLRLERQAPSQALLKAAVPTSE